MCAAAGTPSPTSSSPNVPPKQQQHQQPKQNQTKKGGADATWIFAGWEGVLARRAGLSLNLFAPEDFGVPYGYSPVLAARPDVLT